MPNNTDVTQFYIRSEKVMDIMCDVYQIVMEFSYGSATGTYWVDPNTGFTLKFEANDPNSVSHSKSMSYEVTRLIVGKPNWTMEHLHPRETDEIIIP